MKQYMTPILVLLLAGVTAAWVSHSFTRACAAPEKNIWNAGDLTQLLALTEAQAAQVEQLQKEYQTAVAQCCEKHCQFRAKLGPALFSETVDAAQMEQWAEQLCHAQKESDLATLRHMLEVHKILTPEQKVKYEKLISDCMCKECPFDMSQQGETNEK